MAKNKSPKTSGVTTIGNQEYMRNPGVEISPKMWKLYFENSDTIEHPEEESSSSCESSSEFDIDAAGNSGNNSSFSSGPFAFSKSDATKNSGVSFSPSGPFTFSKSDATKNTGVSFSSSGPFSFSNSDATKNTGVSFSSSGPFSFSKSDATKNTVVSFSSSGPFSSSKSDATKNTGVSFSSSGPFSSTNSDATKNTGVSFSSSGHFSSSKSDATNNTGVSFSSSGPFSSSKSDATKNTGVSFSSSGHFSFSNSDATKNTGVSFSSSGPFSFSNSDATKNTGVSFSSSGPFSFSNSDATKNTGVSFSSSGPFSSSKSDATKNTGVTFSSSGPFSSSKSDATKNTGVSFSSSGPFTFSKSDATNNTGVSFSSSGPFSSSKSDVTKNTEVSFSLPESFTLDSCDVIKDQEAESMVPSEYITLSKGDTVINPKVQCMYPFGSSIFPLSDSKKNQSDKSSSIREVFTLDNSDSAKNQGLEFKPSLGSSTSCNSDAKKIQIDKSFPASGNFSFVNNDSIKNPGEESPSMSENITFGKSDATKTQGVKSMTALETFTLINYDAIKNSKVEGPLVSECSPKIRKAATKNPEDESSSVSGTFTFDKSGTPKDPFSIVTRGPPSHASDERVGVRNPDLNIEEGSGITPQENGKTYSSWSEMFPKAKAILGGRKSSMEISNPRCNAERPESPGGPSNLSEVQLQRKPITHKETQSSKIEARPKSLKIPTAGALARTLSGYLTFSAKISDLEMQNGLSSKSVYSIASVHSHVFNLIKEVITLEPRVTFCLNHISEKGCHNPSICKEIHICPAYVSGTCSEKHCYLGHFWHTDHNLLILESFFIAKLSSFQLSNLFQTQRKINRSSDSLKICNLYNTFSCEIMDCKDLHICLDFVLGITKCKKEYCLLNHDILNTQCKNILKTKGISSNESARDIVLALHQAIPSLKERINCHSRHNLYVKQPRTVWSHHYEGDVQIPEICYHSVNSQCRNEESGCHRLHSLHHYHWQVKKDVAWFNLKHSQVSTLERSFCDVTQEGVDLQQLDLVSNDNSGNGITTYIGQDTWHADFNTMSLRNSSATKKLSIRRLCTESLPNSVIEASTFCWYFLDQNKVWVRYGDYDTNSHSVSAISSDFIEKIHKKDPVKPIVFKTSVFSYILDPKTMKQTNQNTMVSRDVRRRPLPHLKDKRDFPSIWNAMPLGERLLRVTLPVSSREYQMVIKLLKDPSLVSKIKRIERVQNTFLWGALLNKVKEMTTIYGDASKVNVWHLFHGTKASVVRSICLENFDWRLHGSNVGQKYGQGTYFSTDAKYAYNYCQADGTGLKYLFIAKVIVGSVTKGNPSMTRPPKNPATNVNFDSTADCVPNFKILVKYDKQEYYPEYVIYLT